jgi:hypothetical protein
MGWKTGIQFPASRLTLGPTQSPIQQVPKDISPMVKRPKREVIHLPPSSAEGTNTRSYITTHCASSWRDTSLSTGATLDLCLTQCA